MRAGLMITFGILVAFAGLRISLGRSSNRVAQVAKPPLAIEVSPEIGRILAGGHYALYVRSEFSGVSHIPLERRPVLVGLTATEKDETLALTGRELGRALQSSDRIFYVDTGEIINYFTKNRESLILVARHAGAPAALTNKWHVRELIPKPEHVGSLTLSPDSPR